MILKPVLDDVGKNVCYASGIANFRKNAQLILPLRRAYQCQGDCEIPWATAQKRA
jgi:hypothetical protein